MLLLNSLFVLQVALVAVFAQQAIRVDDDDAQIVYSPADSWHRNTEVSTLDEGGYHMVTTTTGATATFTFTGTGIAFMAPRWADTVSSLVTLDGGPSEVVDMTDPTQAPEVDGPSTVQSAILWSRQDLVNERHTLVVSVPPGGLYAVVDMLIYYVPDDTTSLSPTSTETTSTSSTSTSTASSGTDVAAETSEAVVSSSTKMGLSIAIGVVASVFGILFIGGILFWWRRRERKRQEQAVWLQAQEAPSPPPVMDEINDGITAERGRRYKSIPTPRTMSTVQASSSDLASYDAMVAANARLSTQGQGSKLRNVVASQGPNTRGSAAAQRHAHSRSMSGGGGGTSARSPPRKFTLAPEDTSNTEFPRIS